MLFRNVKSQNFPSPNQAPVLYVYILLVFAWPDNFESDLTKILRSGQSSDLFLTSEKLLKQKQKNPGFFIIKT